MSEDRVSALSEQACKKCSHNSLGAVCGCECHKSVNGDAQRANAVFQMCPALHN